MSLAFGEWLAEQGRHVLPKGPIGQAIAYAQSNWAALCRYPERGDLSIDNNLAERLLRAQAIGRRNWTFLGSDRGGRTAAVLYSLTGTCKHHGIDPFAYLQDILRRLPSHPAEQLDELLPDVWFASHLSARRKTAVGTGCSGRGVGGDQSERGWRCAHEGPRDDLVTGHCTCYR